MTRTLAGSPQPDARAATVLLDELHTGRFQSGADSHEGGGPRRVLAGFKPSKGAGRGRSSFGKLIPAPVKQCSGCPKLCRCYVLFHDIPLANVQKHDIRFYGPQGDRARCSSTPPGLTKDQEGPRPMAMTTNTTLGIGRAVTALSRRQFGGFLLAALTGVAFAGAVVLPDPNEMFPAEADGFAGAINRSMAAAPPGQTVEAWARTSQEGRLLLLMRCLTPEQQQVFLRAGRRMAAGMPPQEAALLAFQEAGMNEAEVAAAMAALPGLAGEA